MSPEERIPPSATIGIPWPGERLSRVEHCGHLRHADAGDHAGRADRSGPDPEFHRVRARVGERERALGSRNVPRDHLDLVPALDRADDVEHAVGVTVRGVHHQHVDLRIHERRRPLERVVPDPDRRPDPEPALVVLRRVRVLDPLRDVLDGDEPLEPPLGVDHRELLDLVAVEDLARLVQRRPDGRSHEVAGRHERRDRLRDVGLEAEVAVREDADEDPGLVRDRHAGDPVALHQGERIRDRVVSAAASAARRSSRTPSA